MRTVSCSCCVRSSIWGPRITRGWPLGPVSCTAPVTGTGAAPGVKRELGVAYCIGWLSFSSRSTDKAYQNLPMRSPSDALS